VRSAIGRRAGSALAALLPLLVSCADTADRRDVRVTIVDGEGRPVPGALFYLEVRDADGPFAFEWRVAGQAGEVPDSAYEPLQVPWRPGSRVALAAFAPGHRPAVLRPDEPNPHTDGLVLRLEASAERWNPELAELAFPFEDTPALARDLDRTAAPLLAAFREAWEARPGEPSGSDSPKPRLPAAR